MFFGSSFYKQHQTAQFDMYKVNRPKVRSSNSSDFIEIDRFLFILFRLERVPSTSLRPASSLSHIQPRHHQLQICLQLPRVHLLA